VHGHRYHPGHVGIDLLERNPGFEPCQSLIAEIAENHCGAIKLERRDERGLKV